jgi:hypothetical protein
MSALNKAEAQNKARFVLNIDRDHGPNSQAG